MSTYPTLREADIHGKRVLLRAGFDVPMEDGRVTDAARIEAVVPTMRHILDAGASLIILSHQDRPKGKRVDAYSQRPLVPILEQLLGTTVEFADSCVGSEAENAAKALNPGEVLLLENVRFEPGEEKNDPAFTVQLAALADIYVNDAFPNCHRSHASMVGVPRLLPSFMGLGLEAEVEALKKMIDHPPQPLVSIVSGAKLETKVPVINALLARGGHILTGGAIANTFLAAQTKQIGRSLCDSREIPGAAAMLERSGRDGNAIIHVPTDAVVAPDAATSQPSIVSVDAISADVAMYDIGPATVDRYVALIDDAGAILWNGPLGMYEHRPFAAASIAIARAVARATTRGALTVIGGGDTLDFHARYGLPLADYSFVSTGGGAMLDYVAGTPLPALEALKK